MLNVNSEVKTQIPLHKDLPLELSIVMPCLKINPTFRKCGGRISVTKPLSYFNRAERINSDQMTGYRLLLDDVPAEVRRDS